MSSFRILLLILLSIVFLNCNVDSDFWEFSKIEIEGNRNIATINSHGDTMIVAGDIYQSQVRDRKTDAPFVMISFDNGKNWIEKKEIDCNSIINIAYEANTIIITGVKYSNEKIIQIVSFKYNFKNEKFENIILPNNYEGKCVKIFDSTTYLFSVSSNQFGRKFLKTQNAGESWEEFNIVMNNKIDLFEEMLISDNKFVGIKTHFPSEKSIVILDVKNLQEREEIQVPDNETVVSVIEKNKNYYTLSYIEKKGYIKKINTRNKEFKTIESFNMNKGDLPSKLYFFNEYTIIIVVNLIDFMPNYKILYKKNDGQDWIVEKFPMLINPHLSFYNGRLMGLSGDDILFSHSW